MEKNITDERTGLKYELVGDYYLIADDDEPEERPIGIWGQRHARYLKKHHKAAYYELLTSGKLNDYLADLNEQAEDMFFRVVKQLAEKDASASTLTFTHETWDYVHKEQDAKYPDKKIVGWQHTHPSYGIFLSNYDLFIHENFFNLPFQVAYVIDPVQNLRDFFQCKNGKIEKLKGYYIYDDVGKPNTR